jgi:hypothetical protein
VKAVSFWLLDIGEFEPTGSLAGCGKTIVARWKFNGPQDAQKDQTSHPPNPGAPRRAFSKQGRNSSVDPRFTFHASRFTVLESEARTPLADFFCILLEHAPVARQNDN